LYHSISAANPNPADELWKLLESGADPASMMNFLTLHNTQRGRRGINFPRAFWLTLDEALVSPYEHIRKRALLVTEWIAVINSQTKTQVPLSIAPLPVIIWNAVIGRMGDENIEIAESAFRILDLIGIPNPPISFLTSLLADERYRDRWLKVGNIILSFATNVRFTATEISEIFHFSGLVYAPMLSSDSSNELKLLAKQLFQAMTSQPDDTRIVALVAMFNSPDQRIRSFSISYLERIIEVFLSRGEQISQGILDILAARLIDEPRSDLQTRVFSLWNRVFTLGDQRRLIVHRDVRIQRAQRMAESLRGLSRLDRDIVALLEVCGRYHLRN